MFITDTYTDSKVTNIRRKLYSTARPVELSAVGRFPQQHVVERNGTDTDYVPLGVLDLGEPFVADISFNGGKYDCTYARLVCCNRCC